jgi:hypothetical protein
MEYHERLKKVMKDAGVRNKDLIKPCSVSNGAISQWRSGDFRPKNLLCIAKTCGWDVFELQAYLEGGTERSCQPDNSERNSSIVALNTIGSSTTAVASLRVRELELLNLYKTLNKENQKLLLNTAKALNNH